MMAAADRFEHLRPARQPAARLGREVRPGVERHLLGRGERVQRPAAPAGHRLDRVHVDGVDVRALLAVNLYAHEVRVHVLGHRRILERLALHDVAPVAGRVADREQDRALLVTGTGERLVAPRIPVDRVVLVLEEVGTVFRTETIGHGSDYAR